MSDYFSLKGPVLKLDGQLVLLIPLAAGGDEFITCSRGIGVVEGEFLKVVIKDWLAQHLKIYEGSIVCVDNENGKFNITPEPPVTN
jgi:hypothetical protein